MKIKSGTSIIEVVIAAALISVAIISALSLANYSQKQNAYARDLAEATKYASQGADWIRAERNALGWSTLYSKVQTDQAGNLATYCVNELPSTTANTDFLDLTTGECSPMSYIPGTRYTREITVDTTDAGLGTLKILITVAWMETLERQATIELELTQWR